MLLSSPTCPGSVQQLELAPGLKKKIVLFFCEVRILFSFFKEPISSLADYIQAVWLMVFVADKPAETDLL